MPAPPPPGSVQAALEYHHREVKGGSLDWKDADPTSITGKTVAEAFQLDDSGYVLVLTDGSIYRCAHRIVYDGDWPEFEMFVGTLPVVPPLR